MQVATAHHDVGSKRRLHGGKEFSQLRRRMLAVAIHLHGAIEALAQGQPQSGLHRAADAKVAAQPHHAGAVLARDFGGPISRGIVDDDDFRRESVSLGHSAQLREQRRQTTLFIQRGHNDEDSHPAG